MIIWGKFKLKTMKEVKPNINKVLFYTGAPRAFRTTLIGHLYEIYQVYPIVILSEELDLETESVLKKCIKSAGISAMVVDSHSSDLGIADYVTK